MHNAPAMPSGAPVADARAVDEVVRPPKGNPRFPLLDSVRALAVVAVVGYHTLPAAWWSAQLSLGVTIFFGLSGFLLYRPYVTARRKIAPEVSSRDYAV